MKEFPIHPSPQENALESVPLKRTGPKPLRPQKKQAGSDKGNDIWLLTLSDLLLLLMILFVMLFGLTLQQQPQASPSLPAEASTKAKETPVEAQNPPVSDSASQGILTSLETDLRAILGGGSRKEEVTITRLVNRLVLIFPERIVFDPGRAQLKASAQPILQKVALLISAHPYLLVEVQGHTDDRPINTNRYPSNWELSVDRATQVAKALIALGLNPLQTSVKGLGEYRTLNPNDSESNRRKNRRVEIQFFFAPKS